MNDNFYSFFSEKHAYNKNIKALILWEIFDVDYASRIFFHVQNHEKDIFSFRRFTALEKNS